MQSISWAVSLFIFHLSFFSPSNLVRWSSARKQPQFPPSALPLWCLMLSPVSPLLGFSVIAQPTLLSFSVIAQHLVMVIVTFWFCFSASEMPVIATQLAVDSSSIPCTGLQRIRYQHAAGSRHS
ncbi:hypothetical protein AMECASPLE_038469 [Ameca splendens]|uniref:Uncharacterized protein n=1 Tax=Ameca splendens TaxID=208324 RepID=A0ABV0YVA3_9TELE